MLLQLYFLKWWINSYPCLTKPWGKSFGNPWSIDYVHTNFLFKNLNLFIKYCSRTSKQILKMEDSVLRCKVRIVYINSLLDSRIMMIVPCFTWSQWLQLWTLSLIWQKPLFFWDLGSSLFTLLLLRLSNLSRGRTPGGNIIPRRRYAMVMLWVIHIWWFIRQLISDYILMTTLSSW